MFSFAEPGEIAGGGHGVRENQKVGLCDSWNIE